METVNGYVCRNCADVAYAKRGVDPAHPKDGPNGIYKAKDPAPSERGPAFVLSGGLSSPSPTITPTIKPTSATYAPGEIVNFTA